MVGFPLEPAVPASAYNGGTMPVCQLALPSGISNGLIRITAIFSPLQLGAPNATIVRKTGIAAYAHRVSRRTRDRSTFPFRF